MRVEHFSVGAGGAANTTLNFIATYRLPTGSAANAATAISGVPGRWLVWHREHVAHSIEMYFDDQADAAVRRLCQRLADAGLPSLATRTHRQHRRLLADYQPITAEVTSAGIKDTATGAITLLTG